MKKVLWLIPARSGSKGLRDKNIRCLGGHPLLAWRIMMAKRLRGTIWLSTDSEYYAGIAKEYGAEIPFIRPDHLATDTSQSRDVVLHAKRYADEHGYKFDVLALLQPTSPFVSSTSVKTALDILFNNQEAHSIIAVRTSPVHSISIQPERTYLDILSQRSLNHFNTNRQSQQPEITPCGGFYITKWEYLNEEIIWNKALSFKLSFPEYIDIDDIYDFDYCEFILKKYNIVSYF